MVVVVDMLAKNALKVNFEQRLQLTPSMMVSLRVLTMNVSQLRDFMEEEVMSNPVLEWDESVISHRHTRSIKDYVDSYSQPKELHDSLYEQLRFCTATDEVKRAVIFLIGSLDERGYLDMTDSEAACLLKCHPSVTKSAKTLLQEMDPPGIGAGDLLECMMLQLRRYPQNSTVLLAMEIVQEVLATASVRSKMMLNLKCKYDEMQWNDALNLLSKLDFRPGWDGHNDLTMMQPDVVVRSINGEYAASLSEHYVINLKISGVFNSAVEDIDRVTNQYIQERTFAAKTLLRSIQSRNDTLLKVAQEILRRQPEFLIKGVSHLRPLSVHRIAQALSLHDSTVSRAISGKTILTPHGTFPLRFFITGGVNSQAGTDVSMHEVSYRIEGIISQEDVEHPFSDQDIVSALHRAGMDISRRTVTKYRLQLNIPCAAKRKLVHITKPRCTLP